MCVSRDNSAMIDYTGSTNYKHGICCKPGVTSNVCSQTNDWSKLFACSPTVIDDGNYPYLVT